MIDYRNGKLFLEEKERIFRKLTQSGVPEAQAETVADCFATADVFGVTSHGEAVLPAYIERIAAGAFNLNPAFRVVRETAAFAVLDGDNALGPVSAAHCLRYAANKAKTSGVFVAMFSDVQMKLSLTFAASSEAKRSRSVQYVSITV